MGKLYEISQRYNNLLELLEEDWCTKDDIESALSFVEEEFTQKAQNVALIIKNNAAEIEMYKSEEKRLKEKRQKMENKVANLKSYLEACMRSSGIRVINGFSKIAFRRCPVGVELFDEKLIPLKFAKQKNPEFSKTDIKNAIESGEVVPGAKLITDKEVLRID